MCEAIEVLSPWQRLILGSVPFPLSLFQNGGYELTMGVLTCGHPDSLEVRTGDMSLHAMCLGLTPGHRSFWPHLPHLKRTANEGSFWHPTTTNLAPQQSGYILVQLYG